MKLVILHATTTISREYLSSYDIYVVSQEPVTLFFTSQKQKKEINEMVCKQWILFNYHGPWDLKYSKEKQTRKKIHLFPLPPRIRIRSKLHCSTNILSIHKYVQVEKYFYDSLPIKYHSYIYLLANYRRQDCEKKLDFF